MLIVLPLRVFGKALPPPELMPVGAVVPARLVKVITLFEMLSLTSDGELDVD
jgi:hypothetical protein